MSIKEKPIVRSIHRRGSGDCVVIPPRVLKALGWNRGDMVMLDRVDGRLVLTRIALPDRETVRTG